MLATLLAVASMSQVPTDYNGVWADVTGRYWVIYDSGFAAVTEDKVAWTYHLQSPDSNGGLQPVDNGGFYGHWMQAETCLLKIIFPPIAEPPYRIDFWPPQKSMPEGDFGEVRITDGPAKDQITVNMRDARQISTYFGYATFLGKSAVMNISGTYSEKNISMNLSETGERSFRDISGTVSMFGHIYSLRGKRRWEKATFSYTDRDNGSKRGEGYIIWWPTEKFMGKRPLPEGAITDRIQVFLKSNNNDFPNGTTRFLTLNS